MYNGNMEGLKRLKNKKQAPFPQIKTIKTSFILEPLGEILPDEIETKKQKEDR